MKLSNSLALSGRTLEPLTNENIIKSDVWTFETRNKTVVSKILKPNCG
jgi:hypothetical protein